MKKVSDTGWKPLWIFREHNLSKRKTKIISLYIELTSLCKACAETITDYIIKVENAATLLKNPY